MNIHLREMTVEFKRERVSIPFTDLNFFFGKMGTGKSSIARLIDFCFGGGFELTPVLQTEFASVTLKLDVSDVPLTLFRQRDTQQVLASWKQYQVVVPVKTSQGEVLPGTGVEVLSDLIFYLAGLTSPRVRRSKVNEESGLERLSLRDLLWYCYLDQDEIDSNFFHLDPEASHWKRLKSRDVLRYIVEAWT